MHNPTEEQSTILAAVSSSKSNLIINALAGTGKSTTLEMIERATPTKPVLYLAFNKAIAEAAKLRMLSTTSVKTFNGIGHTIWARSIGKGNLSLDPKKSNKLLTELIKSSPKHIQSVMWESYWPVLEGVARAKALGYVPEGKFPTARRLCTASALHSSLDEAPDDLTADLIDEVLTRSITAAYAGTVDFNDQVYMPALFGGTFPRFPLVLVDEAQDMSPVNHTLIERLAKERLIAVGDRYQSIYGFRGAKAKGMAEMQAKYSMTPLDLSVSFRCPSEIVLAARWRAPNFRWSNEGGHVESLSSLDLRDLGPSPTFICRNNAPLIALAFRLLASGRSVSVAGSDIGPKLLAIMDRLGPNDLSRSAVLSAIDDWQAEREARDSTTAADLAACMRIFASHGDTLAQAILYAKHLFEQKGAARFLTGHKAKGLEFDQVYFLDPALCRSDEQDQNLRYVIQTRSRNELFEIDSGAIR